MRENDFDNRSENKSTDNDFVIPNEAACSAEFPSGCVFSEED